MKFKNILKKSVSISGVGLHTGRQVDMQISPADGGSGIRFFRSDLDINTFITADVSNVFTTNRGTTLKSGEATISTIEHLLSALHALNIEDALVTVNGPEIPIMDGSAKSFMDLILAAGLDQTESTREVFVVKEAFNFTDPDNGAEYAVYPADDFELNVILHFSESTLGDMVATMKTKEPFYQEISDSRTFVFLSEIEPLFDSGLIRGGDIDNAVVIIDKPMSAEETDHLRKKLGKPDATIENGVISSTPLRHKNEPARHKLLDLLGDLALLGKDIQAKIVATRPGHKSNVELAKILKTKYQEYRRSVGRPLYDPNAVPVMNTEDIKTFLPHRYPFLLVDKVIEITPTYIVGIKNVSFNEGFFQGHFPGNPVFPGVLQMEALAQTGGILALKSVSDGEGQWDTYFLKMDNVKFKAKVLPGDTLILKMELMSPIRRGIIQMMGTAYVGNKLVSEGELTAQIVKRQNDQ